MARKIEGFYWLKGRVLVVGVMGFLVREEPEVGGRGFGSSRMVVLVGALEERRCWIPSSIQLDSAKGDAAID